jgi:predicted RNA-binding protein YlxR (DUF448 family)
MSEDTTSTTAQEDRLGRAVLDRTGTMPGRGAYLCGVKARGRPSADCLAKAAQRGGLARVLRCAVRIDPKLVESMSI